MEPREEITFNNLVLVFMVSTRCENVEEGLSLTRSDIHWSNAVI